MTYQISEHLSKHMENLHHSSPDPLSVALTEFTLSSEPLSPSPPAFNLSLEKEMATHSNFLAWEIPWTEEPGGLPSMGSHKVRHN